MSIAQAFIAELKHEASMTRKMLEKVPLDKKDWKPHDKSMSAGRLATHLADNPKWAYDILRTDEFDFLKDYSFDKLVANDTEELLAIFDKNVQAAMDALSNAAAETFDKIWTVKRGDHVVFTAPKKVAIRGWAFSHMIHHRGQLSVFLRLLDVPVPGMYGPSADEQG